MLEIETLENILLTLTLTCLTLYGVASLASSKPNWFLSKTFIKCRNMEEKYNKALQSRKDMLHHYYWNKANNNRAQMKKQEKQIIKIDAELEQMRSQYQLVRKGLPVPLKMF